jgi:hypothetical protein
MPCATLPGQKNSKKTGRVDSQCAVPNPAGLALCTVTVKLGDQTVSKSKFQVAVDEP